MKLYTRQLKSLEALKREKHVMKYAVKHSDDVLSFKELGGQEESTENAAGAGLAGSLISAFGSRSLFNTIIAIAPPILTLMTTGSSSRKKRSNPLQSLAKELVTGYLKWKAIQMAYRGVKMVVSKKDKKEKEH
jgi:hypothetical protein